MANPSDPQSIFDAFHRLGETMKLPSVDVDAVLEHHRKNLEALEKSAKANVAGAAAVADKQREMLNESVQQVGEMARSIGSPGTPQEMMSRQADWARRSFEAAVKNVSDMADIVRRSNTESVDILRNRIRDSMAEIREGYDKAARKPG